MANRPNTSPPPEILMPDSNQAEYFLSVFSGISTSGVLYLETNTETDDSYVLVQEQSNKQRVYSSEAIDAVELESFSTLSDDDVGMEIDSENQRSAEERGGVNCQKEALAGLYTDQPQPVYNAYEQADTVSTVWGSVDYSQENMCYYALGPQILPDAYSTPKSPRTSTLPSRPMTQAAPQRDPPWIPLVETNRTPYYPAGYVAFMPSPGPVGLQSTQEIIQGQPAAEATINHDRRKKKKRSSSPSTLSRSRSNDKGEAPQASVSWEHIVIQKNGLRKFGSSDNAVERRQRGQGYRKGKLTPEAKKKAKIIRGMKSCWRCWNSKIPCSEDEECIACVKRYTNPSPTSDELCCRTGFGEYESAFFPGYLNAHLKKKSIEDMISEYTSGFWDIEIDVDVTTGMSFKPMRLSINFFRAKGDELLVHHHLSTQPDTKDQLVLQYSAPVGLLGVDINDLKKKCQRYIEDMIGNPLYPEQSCAGNPTEIPRKVLELIQQYTSVKEQPLIRKAIMLHAINYSMSRLITFSEDSAARVAEKLGGFPFPYLSSRLLNRQIKYAMHKLHHELTKEVLEGLEKSMRAKSKDSWGPSFCTILILCLCIEDLQIAADTFVVCDLEKDGLLANLTRRDSFTACSVAEEYPYQRCTKLFHDIYRSHRQAGGRTKDGAFNPIKSVCGVDANCGWDKYTACMAIDFQRLISDFDAEMRHLSKNTPFSSPDTIVVPAMITRSNTGRLVSQFLLSFL